MRAYKLPTIKQPRRMWKLIDGESRHREAPETFEMPDKLDRLRVKLRDSVKIGLEHPYHRGERFWVIVTQKYSGYYVGRINNDLVFTETHGFKDRDLIAFSSKHILSVDVPTPEDALAFSLQQLLFPGACAHCGKVHR